MVAVYNSQFPIQILCKFHLCTYQGRNSHGAGKNCCMGVDRTMYSYERKYFVLLQLNCLTRSQIIRQNDHRLICHNFTFVLGKHRRKMIACHSCRILCIHLLRTDDIFYRILIILILQKHLMHFKNSGICFTYFFYSFVV